MSFITRCPACDTAFRVVPDQLKISEGWVRCGHCQQIFDATLDLQPWWPGSEAGAPAPAQVAGVALPPDPAHSAALPQPQSPFQVPDEVGHEADPPTSAVDVAPPPTVPVAAPDTGVDEPVSPAFEVAGQGVELEDRVLEPTAPIEPYLAPLEAHPATTVEAGEPEPALAGTDAVAAQEHAFSAVDAIDTEEASTPSFVRQAQRRAYWRRPGVRAVLALFAVGLLSLAVVQAALHWRDVLAARVPALADPLVTLCVWAGCVVETPRHLSEVVIDSSVLLRKEPGRYVFNAVLRNQATMVVAAPALELTLTDAQDQVLVRRVLLPQEWPNPVEHLPPLSERPLQLELDLSLDETQVMTGYRALLFYP